MDLVGHRAVNYRALVFPVKGTVCFRSGLLRSRKKRKKEGSSSDANPIFLLAAQTKARSGFRAIRFYQLLFAIVLLFYG